jgi:hypothetical protein
MVSIKAIDVGLIFIALILAINLIIPLNEITGNIIYKSDGSEPKCYFHNENDLPEIPLEKCCPKLQESLVCETISEIEPQIKCYNSGLSEYYYLANNKAISYCEKEGYNVEKIKER